MGHEPNILVISDLHLGEDLGGQPRAVSGPRALNLAEARLIDFLNHHAAHRKGGRPWKLVINGDMVDLVAVRLMPDEVGWLTGLHPDDHHYGLGGRAHASAIKLRRVVEEHVEVFRALASFVGHGHELVIVMGNHDAELHWPGVQELFRDALVSLWRELKGPEARREAQIREAVRFYRWFFLEDGLCWIEHGHQYDPYCSFDDALEPATDERQIDPNVGGAILHYVANHFARNTSDHWGSGFFGYLSWWWGQGWERGLGVLHGYHHMVAHLVRHWRARLPERLAARRARTWARLQRIAVKRGLPVEALARLAALRREPVVTELLRIVRAVMLDRLLLLFALPALVLFPLLVPSGWSLALSMGVGGVWAAWASVGRESTDPRQDMRAAAQRIRGLARVPIVVMGHSHDPSAEVEQGGAYFNTGTWVPHGVGERAFTHLQVLRGAHGVRAELLQWGEGEALAFEEGAAGAKTFRVRAEPEAAPPVAMPTFISQP